MIKYVLSKGWHCKISGRDWCFLEDELDIVKCNYIFLCFLFTLSLSLWFFFLFLLFFFLLFLFFVFSLAF
jgi:hypothetical protein